MPDQPQPDIQQRIAAIIRDNSYKNDDDRWLFDFNTDPDDIAEVIVAELGLEPTYETGWLGDSGMLRITPPMMGEDWSAQVSEKNAPWIRVAVESPLSPDNARDFAAALLAAAAVAGENQKCR